MRRYSYIDPQGHAIKSCDGSEEELQRLYDHYLGKWPWVMGPKQYRLLRMRVPAAQVPAPIEIMVEFLGWVSSDDDD